MFYPKQLGFFSLLNEKTFSAQGLISRCHSLSEIFCHRLPPNNDMAPQAKKELEKEIPTVDGRNTKQPPDMKPCN